MYLSDNVFERAALNISVEDNLNQLQEECAELIVAVNHYRRGRITLMELAEEIADVYLMSSVIEELLNGEHRGIVQEQLLIKVEKLRSKIPYELRV